MRFLSAALVMTRDFPPKLNGFLFLWQLSFQTHQTQSSLSKSRVSLFLVVTGRLQGGGDAAFSIRTLQRARRGWSDTSALLLHSVIHLFNKFTNPICIRGLIYPSYCSKCQGYGSEQINIQLTLDKAGYRDADPRPSSKFLSNLTTNSLLLTRSVNKNITNTYFVCRMYYILYSYNKINWRKENVIKIIRSPGQCGSVGWVSYCKVRGCRFNSWSGHMPGLWAWSLVGEHARGDRLMFLSHIGVSLPPFLPPFPSI